MRVLQLAAIDLTVHRFLLPLMEAMRAEGWEVAFACRPGPKAVEVERCGFKFFPIRATRRLHPVELLLELLDIRRVLRDFRPRVLHVHTPIAAFLGRLAGRLERVPLVVYTAHGFYHHEGMPFLKRKFFESLESFALRHWTDLLFTVSREDAAWAEGKVKRLVWIGEGVDLRDLVPKKRFSKEVTVLVASRVVREKGLFELVEASKVVLEEFPDALFVLAGDGPDMLELKRFAESLGVAERWRFLGWRDDVPELMAAAQLFVLPSWREGMPRSILEAMAMGLPVVATDIRGCREEVVHGETGLLVPPKNPEALAEAILKILKDPELAERMGEAGRQRVEELFDERKVIKRQIEAIKRLAP